MRTDPWSPSAPYIVCNGSGILPDTTAVPFDLVDEGDAQHALDGDADVLVDPGLTPDDRDGLESLDYYNRAFLILGKSGGAADVTGTFTFKRKAGDDGYQPAKLTDLEIPTWGTDPPKIVEIEDALPGDFLKLGGDDATDTLLFSFTVTPSVDPEEDVQIIALLYLVPTRGPAIGTERGKRLGAEPQE